MVIGVRARRAGAWVVAAPWFGQSHYSGKS